jgi:hypothetical protein
MVRASAPDGAGDVVYVLALMQLAGGLLGGLGEVLLMAGNPAYLLVPLAKVAVLAVVASRVAAGRRWAAVAMVVVQSVTLAGVGLSLTAGAVPALGVTLNLVGLLMNVAVPLAVIYLCATLLARPRLVGSR